MEISAVIKKTIRAILSLTIVAVVAGVSGAFAYTVLFPQLTVWPWTERFSWPAPIKNTTTVIERTEQILLSPEEGIERFITAPRTAVVSVVAFPEVQNARALSSSGAAKSVIPGLLITNDGLVATYSVEKPPVENRRFSVLFSDGQSSDATFIGFDAVRNIAYYRTARSDTPSIAFTNSADIKPGRRFIAIARNANGDGEKVAAGVISEYARTFNLSGKTVASTDKWEGVFFLDREIDPAFSGGAVVAMNGELIGLIGMTVLDGEERVFVLPANALRQSFGRLAERPDDASRQDFGAYYLPLTPATARALGLVRDRGAYIYTPSEKNSLAVISGSLAERMGVRYGDIIISVNGAEIDLDRPFSVALDSVATGGEVVLAADRGGKRIELRGVR